MATQAFRALTKKDKHTVGNVVSTHKYVKDIANGVVFAEDVDNFHLVEVEYNANGERIAKYLTDATKKGYLVAAVERRYLGESLAEFFNGKDERGRVVYLTDGLIFDTSAYTLSGVAELQTGQKAHYDVTTKKFLVHDGSHADYATAYDKFIVRSSEADVQYTLGVPTVRLVVEK